MALTVFHFLPDLRIGGVLRLLQYNMSGLREKGIENVVIYFNSNTEGEYLLKETGVTLIHVKYNGIASYPSCLFTLIKLVRKLRPMIIHSHLPFDTRFALVLSLLVKVRLVVTLHFAYEPGQPENLGEKLNRWSFLLGLRRADMIIAVSSTIKGLYADSMQDKIIVIHSGIIDKFNLKTDRVLAIRNGSPRILCVGRSHPVKGHEYLVDLIDKLRGDFPDICLYLFTKTTKSSEYTSALLHAIDERMLTKHIVIVEDENDPDLLVTLYKNADVFVLPSRYESLGLTILEAFSFGIPAVASRIGGIPEIITDDYNGYLFEVGDMVMAAKLVRGILLNPDKRQQLSECARHTFLTKFSTHVASAKLSNAYHSLIPR